MERYVQMGLKKEIDRVNNINVNQFDAEKFLKQLQEPQPVKDCYMYRGFTLCYGIALKLTEELKELEPIKERSEILRQKYELACQQIYAKKRFN